MFEEFDLDPKTFFAVANADRICSAGETLYAQGDAADAVFYIHSGEIKLVVTSGEGKEAIVGLLKPGAFLGEGCLVGETARVASAESASAHCPANPGSAAPMQAPHVAERKRRRLTQHPHPETSEVEEFIKPFPMERPLTMQRSFHQDAASAIGKFSPVTRGK